MVSGYWCEKSLTLQQRWINEVTVMAGVAAINCQGSDTPEAILSKALNYLNFNIPHKYCFLLIFFFVVKMEVNSSGKNKSCWWAWGNSMPVLSKTSLSSSGMTMFICRFLSFSIWGCGIQTLQTDKGLEAIALSSQISVFKTVMKWETLEAGKMGKKQSEQFLLLVIFFFI